MPISAETPALPPTGKAGAEMTTKGTSAQGHMKGVRRIIFADDSLTDGSAWCDWVIETLRANGYPNLIKQDAGVAGDNILRLNARFQHDVLDLKPDLVILNIGTNDREPVEDYRRDVEEMVKQLRQSGARTLLCVPPGICDPKDPTIQPVSLARLERKPGQMSGLVFMGCELGP
ncbi:MAG: SGNH/GDSL hydrolase family protein [Planctomycetes bacterium]|nr:SGNH/GDSL hydrolase family protein [Planctomycetota bacterium]